MPGTLVTSIGIRIKDFRSRDLEVVLKEKRSLVEITGLRGAGYVIPSRDYSLFTRAVFPTTKSALQRQFGSAWPMVRTQKLAASDALRQVTSVLLKSLKGKSLTQDEIHAEWRKKLPKELQKHCRGCASFHLPYTVVAAAGLQGTYCFGPEKNGNTAYVLTEEWLGKDVLDPDLESVRRKLVERYLKFHGPSTPRGFAKWAGINAAEALEFWSLVEEDLVDVGGVNGPVWLLKRNAPGFASTGAPKGIHLIPPMDPFLGLSDRETLIEDKSLHSRVWRMIGNPGVLLVDGEIAALWKSQKKGKLLRFSFEAGSRVTRPLRLRAEQEAERIGGFRDCDRVSFEWKS